jgi:arylsulfatase A-like enzyme
MVNFLFIALLIIIGGGVRVPAFIVDFSPDKYWLGNQKKDYNGLMHVSDILPTFMSLLQHKAHDNELTDLDGFDISISLKTSSQSPRKEVLLDIQSADEFFLNEKCEAYLMNDFKLIDGIIRYNSIEV